MSFTNPGQKPRARNTSRVVLAQVVRGQARATEASFSGTFMVGSAESCELQLMDDLVAPNHLQVIFDGILWWARDLNSSNGTYVNGNRIQVIPLTEKMELELGKGGPILSFTVSKEARLKTGTMEAAPAEPATKTKGRPTLAKGQPTANKSKPTSTKVRPQTVKEEPASAKPQGQPSSPEGFASEAEILDHYLSHNGPAGKQTMMFRRAFQMVEKKHSRRNQIVIGVAVLVLLAAGGIIAYQAKKISALRGTAERLFYTTKAVELQIAKLEEIVLLKADQKQVAELMERRAKLKQMEKEYDAFVQELGVYNKIPEDEKVILRVARTFGECEVNVPKGFIAEVQRYIKRWKSSERMATALQKANQRGYTPVIMKAFAERGLPPQFLYLALQESTFNERAIGPATRWGFAKGMWQFISSTGSRYGLKIGPLYDQSVYDPQDERFHWEKATVAAAKYLKELHTSDAQASSLLAMASYNWGEEKVRKIIAELPESPLERNFWRLLRDRRVPAETYDYVLSIFAAAVICENPKLFGFDGECPAALPAPSPAPAAGGKGSGPVVR